MSPTDMTRSALVEEQLRMPQSGHNQLYNGDLRWLSYLCLYIQNSSRKAPDISHPFPCGQAMKTEDHLHPGNNILFSK